MGRCPVKPGMTGLKPGRTDLVRLDWLGRTGLDWPGWRDQKKEKLMIFIKIRTEAMVFRPVPVMKPRKEPKATLRA